MPSPKCPECGKEMEEVVGFSGYVWCRDCHITKKVDEDQDTKDAQESSKKVKT
ncbi:MAG: hypothetical protein V5A76_04695 [Candidatus Thermoplasmatota archaeon]